jgi:hypothetical protein
MLHECEALGTVAGCWARWSGAGDSGGLGDSDGRKGGLRLVRGEVRPVSAASGADVAPRSRAEGPAVTCPPGVGGAEPTAGRLANSGQLSGFLCGLSRLQRTDTYRWTPYPNGLSPGKTCLFELVCWLTCCPGPA